MSGNFQINEQHKAEIESIRDSGGLEDPAKLFADPRRFPQFAGGFLFNSDEFNSLLEEGGVDIIFEGVNAISADLVDASQQNMDEGREETRIKHQEIWQAMRYANVPVDNPKQLGVYFQEAMVHQLIRSHGEVYPEPIAEIVAVFLEANQICEAGHSLCDVEVDAQQQGSDFHPSLSTPKVEHGRVGGKIM